MLFDAQRVTEMGLPPVHAADLVEIGARHPAQTDAGQVGPTLPVRNVGMHQHCKLRTKPLAYSASHGHQCTWHVPDLFRERHPSWECF